MSWLLSPSSATKITPKLIAKACKVGAPRGSGTGSRLTSTRHAWYQVEGLARLPAAGPADRVPQGTSVSIDRLGLLPFAAAHRTGGRGHPPPAGTERVAWVRVPSRRRCP